MAGSITWPPKSPDLAPLDFFSWGHLKSLIYETSVEAEGDTVVTILAAHENIQHSRDL